MRTEKTIGSLSLCAGLVCDDPRTMIVGEDDSFYREKAVWFEASAPMKPCSAQKVEGKHLKRAIFFLSLQTWVIPPLFVRDLNAALQLGDREAAGEIEERSLQSHHLSVFLILLWFCGYYWADPTVEFFLFGFDNEVWGYKSNCVACLWFSIRVEQDGIWSGIWWRQWCY